MKKESFNKSLDNTQYVKELSKTTPMSASGADTPASGVALKLSVLAAFFTLIFVA